jgi:hypothetical protein
MFVAKQMDTRFVLELKDLVWSRLNDDTPPCALGDVFIIPTHG